MSCKVVVFEVIPLATFGFVVGGIYFLVTTFSPAIGIALSLLFGTLCLTFIVKILLPFYRWLAESGIVR